MIKCPFMSRKDALVRCYKENCALWDTIIRGCVFRYLGQPQPERQGRVSG